MRRIVCFLALAGCGDDNPPPDPPPAPTVEYLSPTDHLVRAAMTLRGKRPTLAELEAVAADPSALPGIVDGYLDTPELGTVMRDLHAENLLVRIDQPFATFKSIGPVADRTAGEINANVFEEPLRLIEHVIVNDRPYSEIVTASYAITEPVSAAIWGMSVNADGTARWNDQRPVAGILSSSGLWARHQSAGSNYNRGRANLISRALLCFDFLHSDINIDTSVDLANPQAVQNALRDNPACVGCHQALDPLATTIFGFQKNARYATYPVPMWRADWVDDWIGASDRPPAYFGQAATDVRDVGARIAADPRFPRCAAQRFAAYFTQQKQVPFAWVSRLTDAFIASDFDAKQLAREIVLSDEFRVSHVNERATADEAEALRGMLRVRPEQLDSLFEDLTGFRWHTDSTIPIAGVPYGRANLLRTDFLGFRALSGGIDGYFVTEPTHTTNAVSSLLLRTLASTAAGFVVDTDFGGGTKRLLTDVTEATTDEPAIRAQLAKLHARIYGTLDPADGDAVGETYALFASVIARGATTRVAWKTTLTAMLGDLRVAHY
jgi:hypothetical protein